jgi:hypothetical protein
MEQVMDAVVDADGDGAIPKLSQPSQLSSVSLEVNEVPVLLVTGMRYAVVIAECECCTNHFLFAARVNTHREHCYSWATVGAEDTAGGSV